MELKSVQDQIESRWRAFQKNREFRLFEAGRSDASLKEEFEQVHAIRQHLWTTPDYEVAQHLIAADLIRSSKCGAFAYNNTVPYYNASTMCIGNTPYIACEGPRSKDVSNFFKFLEACQVTHLVRLTDSHEDGVEKCHPYWDGMADASPVRAFAMAHWKDHQGVDPDELLALVLQVRKELSDTGGLLAVHCSGGVGRTGTFLAALAIVDAIDRGGSFSIEEIVYRLSLQRALSVAKFGQYITLYRLAESYLNACRERAL